MNLERSFEQNLLCETSARFVESTCPLSTVRELSARRSDPGASYRNQAGDLGWFATLAPETLGGGAASDNGVVDCALIAAVRGATLQPIAFVPHNIVVSSIATDGTAEQRREILPGLISGSSSATWAVMASHVQAKPEEGVIASRVDQNTYSLTGKKVLVQDADVSDFILLTAASDEGPVQFLLPTTTSGLVIDDLASLDLTRGFNNIRFDSVTVSASTLVGDVANTALLVEQQLQLACALTVAESVGAMGYVFGLALEYAKDRIAFGRPIGSFQAIKHLLADTSLLLEMCRAMAESAAQAVGSRAANAGMISSMAKAFVSDCGIELAQNCFQVFGGIGYTWEHDQHLYLRRLTTDAALYWDSQWHRERVCRLGGM
jgi:alkylation response protein AidB-like acyl-CoA dehydrogenase